MAARHVHKGCEVGQVQYQAGLDLPQGIQPEEDVQEGELINTGCMTTGKPAWDYLLFAFKHCSSCTRQPGLERTSSLQKPDQVGLIGRELKNFGCTQSRNQGCCSDERAKAALVVRVSQVAVAPLETHRQIDILPKYGCKACVHGWRF
ncbi:hypothetical protein WJX82_002595 [Trebouxia sp. C0006]